MFFGFFLSGSDKFVFNIFSSQSLTQNSWMKLQQIFSLKYKNTLLKEHLI